MNSSSTDLSYLESKDEKAKFFLQDFFSSKLDNGAEEIIQKILDSDESVQKILRRYDPERFMPENEIYHAGYERFLDSCIDVIKKNYSKDELVKILEVITDSLAKDVSSHKKDFQAYQPKDKEYSRIYIGFEKKCECQGFESLICKWNPGSASAIHGHPDFVYYKVLEGAVVMRFFQRHCEGKDCVKFCSEKILRKGDSICGIGYSGQYDYLIHEVSALEPSLSLHIYSDDARKGKQFREV